MVFKQTKKDRSWSLSFYFCLIGICFFFTFENFVPLSYYKHIFKLPVMIIFTVVKRTCILVLLILSVFWGSCERPNVTDHSYTLEEYQELGMPDQDTVWSMEDYDLAFYVLNTLKYTKPYTLPAKNSEKSGKLFARMMNLDNLTFLEDETLPLHEKAQTIKWWLNIYHDLRFTYTHVAMKRQYYIRELADIDIFGVGLVQKMLDLGDELNESEDPNDVVMQADLPAIQKMYEDLLTKVIEKQQHTTEYPERTLELLSDSLSNSVRRNMDRFDEDASEKIKQAMLMVMDSTSSRKIRKNYKALIEIL